VVLHFPSPGGSEMPTLEVLAAGSRAEGNPVFPLDMPEGQPVSLAVSPDRTEFVVFVHAADSVSAPWGLMPATLRRYVLTAKGLSLASSSPKFETQMAGAGSTFGRAGDRVYAVEAGGRAQYWDLVSEEILADETLPGLLKAYDEAYAPNRECLSPPYLYGYRGALVVVYYPAAYDAVRDAAGNEIGTKPYRTMYVVAMREGEVVGEIILHRGKLTVRKGGAVTQETDLAPEYTGDWQFPNLEDLAGP
jgi:hypothetical protein